MPPVFIIGSMNLTRERKVIIGAVATGTLICCKMVEAIFAPPDYGINCLFSTSPVTDKPTTLHLGWPGVFRVGPYDFLTTDKGELVDVFRPSKQAGVIRNEERLSFGDWFANYTISVGNQSEVVGSKSNDSFSVNVVSPRVEVTITRSCRH
jgi:hypothetical protein